MTRLLLLLLMGPALLGSTPPEAPPGGRLRDVAERAGLRPQVLETALRAHRRAVASRLTASPLLTVIDYSLPSRARRLWVLDLTTERVLAREYVAHGRNSGDDLA